MKRRVAASLLGAADGVTSIAGVISGGAHAGIGPHQVAKAAIAGALSATVSMAGAEGLSEEKSDWGAITAMGLGTLLGSALPAIPLLLFPSNSKWVWAIVVAIAGLIGIAVGEVRYRSTQRNRFSAWGLTLLVLAVGAGVGYLAGGA